MFELHITCTKDIEKLSIDFSDGSSVIQEKPKQEKPKIEKSEKHSKDDVDWSKYNQRKVSQEVVQKPEIPDRTEAKVDDILQGLEF
jgi:hypothetical protein